MSTRIDSLDTEAFGALFTSVRKSWFRLEALQHYDVGYERDEFAAFLRGETLDRTPGPWQEMVTDHVAHGRALARVHVIQMPPTDYVRYELACYPLNAEAGEHVRLIPVTGGEWPSGVVRHDYWLFDDQDVWLMVYDEAGRFLHAEQRNSYLPVARASRDAALRQSVPLDQLAAALPRAS